MRLVYMNRRASRQPSHDEKLDPFLSTKKRGVSVMVSWTVLIAPVEVRFLGAMLTKHSNVGSQIPTYGLSQGMALGGSNIRKKWFGPMPVDKIAFRVMYGRSCDDDTR